MSNAGVYLTNITRTLSNDDRDGSVNDSNHVCLCCIAITFSKLGQLF